MNTPACPSKQLPDVHVIKTMVEPCEESPAPAPASYPAPDATEDWETTATPLSGNHPFFTVLMSRSHVQKPFQLCIQVDSSTASRKRTRPPPSSVMGSHDP